MVLQEAQVQEELFRYVHDNGEAPNLGELPGYTKKIDYTRLVALQATNPSIEVIDFVSILEGTKKVRELVLVTDGRLDRFYQVG